MALLVAACADNGTAPAADTMSGDSMMGMGMDMPTDVGLTDEQVFQLIQKDTSWVYYKFSDSLLVADTSSPHQGYIRTRYNTLAATQLDSIGKVRSDATFPDSSALVKEIYNGGVLQSLAVMFKHEDDVHASHGSWLWAEYTEDGHVLHSVADRSDVCHDCHVRGGIDHTQMNRTHP